MEILIVGIIAGVVALAFAALRVRDVLAEDQGDEAMQRIARAIQEGSRAFLERQYLFLAGFVAVVFFILLAFIDYDILGKLSADFEPDTDLPETALSYLIGAILSAGAGYLGMTIAVRANVRTAAQARTGLNRALRTAFNSGTVMGMTVVGLGLLGVAILYVVWEDFRPLTGFAFGASSIALFARVGGGIFTKAADVGADLVGKIEVGIPEDDPRNPATIADNVGDNVGDVAGMGADLFESYVGSIVATIGLATLAVGGTAIGAKAVFGTEAIAGFDSDAFVLPILVAGIGIFAAVIGSYLVRTGEQADQGRLLWALRAGVFGTSGLVLLGVGIAIAVMGLDADLFFAILVGLIAGQIIGTVTEGFTSSEGFRLGPVRYSPTISLSNQAQSGAGPVLIGGISLGMLSTAVPLLTIVVAIFRRAGTGRLLRHRAGRSGDAGAAGRDAGDGRLRPGRRQRRGHRPAGEPAAGSAAAHRRAGPIRQHHRRDGQGVRDRIGHAHIAGAAGDLRRNHRGERLQPPGVGRDGGHPAGRADAVPVQRPQHGRCGSGRDGDGGRGPPAVPRAPRHHGWQRAAPITPAP